MNTGFWAGLFAWLFGQESEDSEEREEKEKFHCETCNRRISEGEYCEFNELCKRCRGAFFRKVFLHHPDSPSFRK